MSDDKKQRQKRKRVKSEKREDYRSPLEDLNGPEPTWEEIQAIMAKIPGSLTEDFDRERDERF
jgi:hypothetical protein